MDSSWIPRNGLLESAEYEDSTRNRWGRVKTSLVGRHQEVADDDDDAQELRRRAAAAAINILPL